MTLKQPNKIPFTWLKYLASKYYPRFYSEWVYFHLLQMQMSKTGLEMVVHLHRGKKRLLKLVRQIPPTDLPRGSPYQSRAWHKSLGSEPRSWLILPLISQAAPLQPAKDPYKFIHEAP